MGRWAGRTLQPQQLGQLRGYNFPLVTGNVIPWGVVGWTLVALTADPWNIKPKMFSLGENLALLQNSRIIAPAPAEAAARCPEFQLLLAFLDRSHTLLPALSRPITVGKKVKTRKDPLLALWPSDPVPLHLCLPPLIHTQAPRAG